MLGEQVHTVDGESEPRARLTEQVDIAGRLATEREVLADDDLCDMQTLDQDLVDVPLGRELHELRREGHDAEDVDSQLLGQLGPPRQRRQLRRVTTRAHDLRRMRIECHEDTGNSTLTSRADRAGNQLRVPTVHAVENADRQDTTPPVRRHIVQTSPSLHRWQPTATADAGHVRTDSAVRIR